MKASRFLNIVYMLMGFFALSCVKGDFKEVVLECATPANTLTLGELAERATEELIQLQESITVVGYVVSSQTAGQFYGKWILQDRADEPTMGILIETDATHTELLAAVGSKVAFQLQGLYLQKKNGVLRIGGVFPSFGNLALGRIPVLSFKSRVQPLCESGVLLKAQKTTLENLAKIPIHTLVQLDSISFRKEDRNTPFAKIEGDQFLSIRDCKGDSLLLKVSSYSDFALDSIPEFMGSLQGVYQKEKGEAFIEIASLKELHFSEIPCELLPQERTSNKLFISEIADPKNNTKARFIELYHSDTIPLPLRNWRLLRYTNGNSSVSHQIVFTEEILGPKKTFVIAVNGEEFLATYGFAPDWEASSNSAAGSNGDDNLVLVDPYGKVIDLFGVIGEDGTGTDHDFEDGRVVRNPSQRKANPLFTPSEWTITRTIEAPLGFNPGIFETVDP